MKSLVIRIAVLAFLFTGLQFLLSKYWTAQIPAGFTKAEVRFEQDQRRKRLLPVQTMIVLTAGWSAFLMVKVISGDPGQLILLERTADRLSRQESRIAELEDRILTGKKRAEEIGHQMKTRLGSMALFADLCMDHPDALENLQTEILESDHLIREMLDSYTRRYDQPGFRFESVDIGHIVYECIPPLAQVRISGSATGFADPFWLRAALETLMENAAEYGSGSIEVQIETSARQNRITISSGLAHTHGETSGTGIPEPSCRGSGHYGIGLEMARSVIRQHHGCMTVQKKQETFCICIQLPRHWLEE
ncbi:sensor histidine kinase [Faecalibaculum rodentium]|uniref:sensor histidine kinase n=2 Tax=Faecalibaculum rodentium TaxID=1702221 RepID=UPI0023F10EEF|nr:ATP-binding protein [Faecalibaculum rodentium]